MGLRAWGSLSAWGLEFGVWGLLLRRFAFRVWGLRFEGEDVDFRVQGSGFEVWSWGFEVWGLLLRGFAFRVWGSRFEILGLRVWGPQFSV